MAPKVDFPPLGKDKLLAVFYLFGKDYGVIGESEVNAASGLLIELSSKIARDIRVSVLGGHSPENGCTILHIENYTKRSLQIDDWRSLWC